MLFLRGVYRWHAICFHCRYLIRRGKMEKVFSNIFCRAALALSIFLASAVTSTAANANYVYTYTGNVFTLFQNGTEFTNSRVTAIMTLDALPSLPSGLVDVTGLSGFSLTMTSGAHTLSNSSPNVTTRANISFLADGNIGPHWWLTLDDYLPPLYSLTLWSLSAPTTSSDFAAYYNGPDLQDGYIDYSPGEWRMEYRAVPVPHTAALLALALAGLGFSRRKRIG